MSLKKNAPHDFSTKSWKLVLDICFI